MRGLFLWSRGEQSEYLREHLPENDAVIACAVQECPPAAFRMHEVLSVFVTSQVTAGDPRVDAQFAAVAARATGYDQIDLEARNERHITVFNVPRYGENTVAEHTFGLILFAVT